MTTNPRVTIALEDGRRIVAELYPEKAPNTVSNFISLANSGYFAGKVFHRAMSGFMIQGGSPTGDGTSKGFPYSIKGEMKNNGFAQNDISHTQGVLSMARLNGLYDSASCQFFIMHGAAGYLDNEYAAFGKVIEGMDVVDAIATSPVTYSSPGAQQPDRLITPVVIKSVTAETFGVVYPEPATLPAVG
ncbi:MAG: peptidylprolyl isomerase [Oscillospiraceae bacterium]|nr:peptidylprolyl isomerase [Oscillospiraceae bacterium]